MAEGRGPTAVGDVAQAMAEAKALGLFQPQSGFEVHCAHCHGRLNGQGDCPTCGLIGRPEAEIERRARADPAGAETLLRGASAKRKAYRPVKR